MKDYNLSDDYVTYVPEFDNNRMDGDPVTVEIMPLTVREARQSAKSVTARRKKGGGIQTDAAELNLKIIRSHAKNIKNLRWNGKDVTTVEELESTSLTELMAEIEEAINDISILNEGDIKNLKSQSIGTEERNHGTATNAPQSGSESETVTANSGTMAGNQ